MADTTVSEVCELFTARGLLTSETVEKVMEECDKSGKDAPQAMLDLNLVPKEDILQTVSGKLDVPFIDLSELEIDPEIGKIVPKELAKDKIMIAFSKEEEYVFLAMKNPQDSFAIEDVSLRLGIQVKPYFALGSDIMQAIARVHKEKSAEEGEEGQETQISQEELAEDAQEMTEKLIEGLGKGPSGLEVEVDTSLGESEDIMMVNTSAPVVEKLINAIILEAIRLGASDIHVEPFEKKLLVRYRVDGALRKSSFKVPFTFKNALIAKIKIMGSMNITERRIPQDGRISIKVRGKPFEFRVNIVPTVMGESAVLRILDRSGAKLTLDQLGFLEDTKNRFLESLDKPYGLILVCGPTGSGKSFTLMAALAAVRDPEEKILTAENPVEYNLEGVVQVQVNPDLSLGDGRKFDFSSALRAFLRQDPDTIMVGEIRDEETGHIACEAAMTGHLVLSTIHTNDATSVIGRLAEMGVPPYLIASTLECVLAQRLIRTLCKFCKVPDPNPAKELLQALAEAKIPLDNPKFMKAKGCAKCGNKGLKGRTAIHELLVMSDEVRNVCKPGVKNSDVNAVAIKAGMRTLMQDGLAKVSMGLTSYEEILATAK